jgi:hypothetical protein
MDEGECEMTTYAAYIHGLFHKLYEVSDIYIELEWIIDDLEISEEDKIGMIQYGNFIGNDYIYNSGYIQVELIKR